MGFRETQNKNYQNLTFKYSAINKQKTQNLRVSESIFSMAL